MRTSMKAARLIAVVPAGVVGGFIAVIGLGFLPGAGLVLAFLGAVVASLVLATGALEGPAARLFGFARGPRPGEHSVLEPALQLVGKLDLAPGRVLVGFASTGNLPAVPIGRTTVIVEPWLAQGLHEHRLTIADAATAIGHAVARQQVGPSKFDLAARLWAFPWTMLYVVVRPIARAFSWVPTAALAWRLRIVVGVVVVVQGFQPGGDPALGIATGALVAVSYIAPAADRAWRAVVERDADRIVAHAGLADSMVAYAQWQLGADSIERVHHIRAAGQERKQQKARAAAQEGKRAAGQPIARVLTHPATLR